MLGSVAAFLLGAACFWATTRIDEENLRRALTLVGIGLLSLGSLAAVVRSVLRLASRFDRE